MIIDLQDVMQRLLESIENYSTDEVLSLEKNTHLFLLEIIDEIEGRTNAYRRSKRAVKSPKY